jgi:hypothetical protein
MEIKPTYVTFEQAKWLKEKGFDEECKFYYDLGFKELTFHVEDTWKNSEIQNGYPNGVFEKLGKYPMISAPEQWKVVEWLRVNHSIWVLALPTINGYYAYKIIDVQLNPEKPIERPPYNDVSGEDYHTPQEAYSAAFGYVLNNLL